MKLLDLPTDVLTPPYTTRPGSIGGEKARRLALTVDEPRDAMTARHLELKRLEVALVNAEHALSGVRAAQSRAESELSELTAIFLARTLEGQR